MFTLRRLIGVMVCVAALAQVGCSTSGNVAYNVGVNLDSSLASKAEGVPTVPVDVVGVAQADLPAWEAVGVSEYFAPNNALRESAKKEGLIKHMTFGPGRTGMMTIRKGDPIWTLWAEHHVTTLVVLADLPDSFQDKPGEADPRRKLVPMDKARWADIDTIRILVLRGGIRLETQPAKP